MEKLYFICIFFGLFSLHNAITVSTNKQSVSAWNQTDFPINERYRRLLPYMTFYLTNEYNSLPNQAYASVPNQEITKQKLIALHQLKYHDLPHYQSNRGGNYNYNQNQYTQGADQNYHHKINYSPYVPSNKLQGLFSPLTTNSYIPKPQPISIHNQPIYQNQKANYNTQQYRRPQPQHLHQQYNYLPEPITQQNIVNYKPGNLITYEALPTYTTDQRYELIKPYDQNIPKYNQEYGGFKPITVTTLSPESVSSHSFAVTPPQENYILHKNNKNIETVSFDDNYHDSKQYQPEIFVANEERYNGVQNNKDYTNVSRSSLADILKSLQETNRLPHTLTSDNIDNSIKTLVQILNHLKQTHKNVILATEAPGNDYQELHKDEKPIHGNHEESNVANNDDIVEDELEKDRYVGATFPGPTSGRIGIDYPALATIPHTSFNCKDQRYKGFFGDPETKCQVWHYCDLNGGQASFLCPNGTIFSQVALTCDWWFNVKCSSTAQLYVLNERLYKYILPFTPKFPEDYSGPLVDKYLAMKFHEMEEKMKKRKKVETSATESDMETVEMVQIKPNGESIQTDEH